ncbi:CLUMA_CG018603, isoform A [Clunio marinus]|uniref:CLUMA_CG018603, isoform A n=1 Tax=Clunio marinus TaxID=568069 RepID=A0A1J1J360_9DIPT|nr:CLUMA_CG018603, isoform A [Clunio marinus]
MKCAGKLHRKKLNKNSLLICFSTTKAMPSRKVLIEKDTKIDLPKRKKSGKETQTNTWVRTEGKNKKKETNYLA